jgi:nucleoside-diphosphate-sugar epimerase
VPSRILLAGAAGAIGRRLVPLLVDAGHEVFGTTRSEARARALRSAAVSPVVMDAFDAPAVARIVAAIHPEVVIHQLTDLPAGLDPSRMAEALVRNARIRSEGTRNLVAAALGAGARRLIAQSIAWVYAPGGEPHSEADPLDLHAEGTRALTVEGVVALERLTTASPPLEGVVLRYGQIYGPGTGRDAPAGSAPLHVDAAAHAALLAIDRAEPGIFNIAEESAFVSSAKARGELGWNPRFRLDARQAARSPSER